MLWNSWHKVIDTSRSMVSRMTKMIWELIQILEKNEIFIYLLNIHFLILCNITTNYSAKMTEVKSAM